MKKTSMFPRPLLTDIPHPSRWLTGRTWLVLVSAWAILAWGGSGTAAEKDDSLLGQWRFVASQLQEGKLEPLAGGPRGVVEGAYRLDTNQTPHRLILGTPPTRILLSEKPVPERLPKETMTVEAWLTLDKSLEWGGIAGVLQDNGSHERGWLLGYIGSQFSFALASTSRKRLTYLKGTSSFQPGLWYHVVGTYDGRRQSLYVNGRLENQSTEQAGPILYPTNIFYELGAYHDDNETYPAQGALYEVSVYQRCLNPEEIQQRFQSHKHLFPIAPPPPRELPLRSGPFVDWIDADSIRITWETKALMPTRLEWKPTGRSSQILEDTFPKQQHALVLHEIESDLEHTYRIHGAPEGEVAVLSKSYQFDSSFYYGPASAPPRPSPYPEGTWTRPYQERARRILEETGITQGFCLVLGAGRGQLAYELARQSQLKVVGVEENPDLITQARRHLEQAGLYGVRVSMHQGDLKSLPYGSYVANLIVSDNLMRTGSRPATSPAEIYRLLRPCGGTVWMEPPSPADLPGSIKPTEIAAWLEEDRPTEVTLELSQGDEARVMARRGRLPGAGDWSHQYGDPDNSACSKDDLVQGEVDVLWWGDPGPRPMPDRGGRNPAPLSAHGRMFVQGDRVFFGIDAYNGTVLWTWACPEIRRSNMVRDSSNMAASKEYLYVAHRSDCLGVEAQHGTRDLRFEVPSVRPGPAATDWGYLAVVEDLLVGSSVAPQAEYRADRGEWYDDVKPEEIAKVTSDTLFGFNRYSTKNRWIYDGGVILNSTITIGDGVIYFIESRSTAAKKRAGQRLLNDLLTDQHLVALDLNSGRQLWEQPFDFSQGEIMLYMAYGQGQLMVTGSDRNKHYHSFAFEAGPNSESRSTPDGTLSVNPPGTLLWKLSHAPSKTHHGGHLQHPLIIGPHYYVDNRIVDLASGEIIRSDLPDRRGCGTMSASLHSVFYRGHFHGMWDLKTDQRTEFQGIRGGCWLGLIPSQGLLLAPESSSGCSCTHAIQTSVAFLPRAQAKPAAAVRDSKPTGLAP